VVRMHTCATTCVAAWSTAMRLHSACNAPAGSLGMRRHVTVGPSKVALGGPGAPRAQRTTGRTQCVISTSTSDSVLEYSRSTTRVHVLCRRKLTVTVLRRLR
jgi:hypothetical protein